MACRSLQEIIDEISAAAARIDDAQVDAVVAEILRARRVFVAGAGRSGLCMRAFVNRLMHLGFDAHFAGDVTAPPAGAGDLLLIGSGSGRTAGMALLAEKAAALGVRLCAITLAPESPVGARCAAKIIVPGAALLAAESDETSAQPMGSLFEQLCFLTCDAMVLRLMQETGQSSGDLAGRHGNLE